MGFSDRLEKAQKAITKLKTTTPNDDKLAGTGNITLATNATSEDEYDARYDPTDKKNAGHTSVETASTLSHVFEDADVAKFYADLYEKAGYEGRGHFDPTFYWEPREERHLIRKTDWYVCFWAFVMFFALDVDRYNLANAVSGTFFEDLKLTTNDYNLGNTVNLICFLLAEIPSQLISKKLGPDVWIPIQMVAWSLVAIFQCFMKNKTGFLVTRALVGLFEGGFIPDVCLWMSYFYTSSELSVRVSYFYIANPLTGAISSLMAYGIYHLEGHRGWKGWQWIFMIEGVVTLVLGIASFFKMPPSAVQTKAVWRPKGWYTDREEKIMVNRVLRDDPSKGDMHNRAALTPKLILKSMFDWHLWPLYLTRFFLDIIGSPVKTYLPIIIRSMGFSTLNTNLLMIPYNVGTIITMLGQAHLSRKTKQIGYWLLLSAVWVIPGLFAMRFWPGFLTNHWGSYALLTVTLAYPPSWALSIAWASANSNSVRTRTISAAMINVFSQLANIAANQIFRADDKPRYHRGLKNLIIIGIVSVLVVLGSRLFLWFINRSRDRAWKKLNQEERLEYTRNTTDEGNKRLDFRFVL